MGEERRRNPAHENLNQAIFRSDGVIIMRMGVRGGVLLEKLAQAAIWVTTRPPFCQIPHSTLRAAMYDTKDNAPGKQIIWYSKSKVTCLTLCLSCPYPFFRIFFFRFYTFNVSLYVVLQFYLQFIHFSMNLLLRSRLHCRTVQSSDLEAPHSFGRKLQCWGAAQVSKFHWSWVLSFKVSLKLSFKFQSFVKATFPVLKFHW